MAFQQPNGRNINMPASNNGDRQSWQNDAFINIYLPRKDGTRAKLGAVGLKSSRVTDAQLLEYIANAEDAEAAMATIKERLVLDYQRVGGEDSAGLDL